MSDADKPWLKVEWIKRTQYLLNSYEHWLGSSLVPRSSPEQDSHDVYHASFILVAHGTEDDPLLNYGNLAALELWQMPLSQLLGTPSRKTAEPVHRSERAQLLQRTQDHGFIDDYSGIRISSTGQRFRIHQAIVWNVVDDHQNHIGQAATFSDWTMLQPPVTPDDC